MADVSYESLQSQISEQRTQITTQQEFIKQERVVGQRSIESLRRVHPKTKPSRYFGEIQPRMESIRGRLGELESAEKELTIAEQKLSEQEKLLQERKAEGYEVRETAEGDIQFFKPAPPKPTSPYGSVVRTETHEGKTIAIHYDTGVVVYPEAHMISEPGKPFRKLPSHPEAKPYRPTPHVSIDRHLIEWYGWKQQQEEIAKIGGYAAIYEKIPAVSVLKKRLPTPVELAKRRELPKEVIEHLVAREVTTATRTFTQAEIVKLLAGKTKEEKLFWYRKNVRFGEDGKTWAEIKREQPDWDLKVKDGIVVIATPEADREQLLKVMGREYERLHPPVRVIRAGAISYLSLFRPETWIAAFMRGGGPLTGGILGVQPRIGYEAAVSTLEWEYPITKIEKPVEKFVAAARPAYETVVIPFVAGAGIGAAFKGIGLAAKAATGFTAKALTKFAAKVPYVYGGVISAMVGADIGYTAAMEKAGLVRPDTTLAKISKYGMQFTFAIAGARWAVAPKPIREPFIKREILYRYGERGELMAVAQRKYIGILGKKIPIGKPVVGIKPSMREISPKPLWTPAGEPITPEPRGLAQPPFTGEIPVRGVPLPVSYAKVLGKAFVETGVGWQMRTGIPLPGVYTGRQPILRPTAEIIPIKPRVPGRLVDYYPLITTRISLSLQKSLKFLSKGMEWQPRTGIPLPEVRDVTGRVVKYVPPEERITEISQLEKIFGKKPFRLKPAKEIITRVDVTKEGVISVEKYGRRFIDTGIARMPDYDPLKAVIEGKFILRKPKPSIPYEPAYMKFIAKGMEWQPKTGVGLPEVRDVTGRVVKYVPPEERITEISQLERIFGKPKLRLRPKKPFDDVVYRITPSAEIWMGKEFYRGLGWQPRTGIPLPGVYTGRQPILRPTAEIIPIKPRVPGRLILWDWLTYKSFLETGVPAFVEKPLVKLRIEPKKRIFTLKDILRDQEQQLKDIGEQITRDGQILILKPVVKEKPITLQKQIERQIKISEQVKVSKPKQVYRQRFETLQRKMLDVEKIDLGKTMLSLFPVLVSEKRKKLERIGISGLIFESATEQMQMQKQASILLFGKPSIEIQEQIQMQKMVYEYPEVFKFVYPTVVPTVPYYPPSKPPITKPPREEPPFKPTPKPPPPFILPSTPYKLFGHTMGQGYNVKIKERHIVKGKKIKEPRFLRINKRPLSLRDAKSLRGMVLDNSAAASGKIVPVNAMAQESMIDLKPFEDIQHKFYIKDDILIEKRKHRIDTRGEVKGISALGWYAERTEKVAKKRAAVVRRPRERMVREPVDMFDMGMDDILINMDKIFKGVMRFGF